MEARFESKRFHGSSSKHYGHKNSRIFCSRRSGVFRRSQAWVSSTRTSNWSSHLDRKVSIMKFLLSLDLTIQRIRYIRLIKLFCTLDAPVLRDIKETFASCVFQDTTMKITEGHLQDVYHAVVMVIPSFVTGKLVMLLISQY